MKRIAKGSGCALGLAMLLCAAFLPARADTFYVSNNTNNTVEIFGPTGHLTNVLSSGLSGPGGMALLSNKLYVANSSNNTIEVFSLPGTQGTVFASVNLGTPSGLAFDKNGNLYAANWASNTIVKFNSSGQGTLFANTGLNRPTGLVFDRSGNLYAANFGNGTIEKFGTNGVGSVFVAGLDNPVEMAFDSSGNLYVSNAAVPNGWIGKITSNGVGSVFLSGIDDPTGIGFDGAGNFYVVVPPADEIGEVATNGQGSLFAYDTGLCGAVGLLIQSPLTIGCPTNPPCTNIVGQCYLGTNTVYGGNGTGVIPFWVMSNVATNAMFVPYAITSLNYPGRNPGELDFGNGVQGWSSNVVNGCGCSVYLGEQFSFSPARPDVAGSFAKRLAINPYVVMPVVTNGVGGTATISGFVWAKILSVTGSGNWQLTLENVPSCGVQVPPADDSSVPVTGACGAYTVIHDPDVINSNTCPNGYSVTRTYRATDTCGNTGSISQIFAVNDTTAPWISSPSSITVNTDSGKCTASNVNLGKPDAGTGCSGDVTLSNNAPSVYPKGTTRVIWKATTPCGTRVTCTQTVTVVDNQLPAIVCPAPLAVSCASAVPLPNPAAITASDNCGSVNVTFVSDTITNQSCPDRYTVLRTYRATDASGNNITCTQTITVNATSPPTITAPSDVTTSTDPGQCYASSVALGSPVTASPCGGALTIANNAPAVFPKGSTQVIWSATDTCGNRAGATQNVLVTDNQPPLVACPSSILVNAQDTNGAVVAFSVTASDNCDSNLIVNCIPVSGSEFVIGTTPVNCVVVDFAGNTNTCSFSVTVVDPSIFTILSITTQSSDILLSWVMPLGLTGIVQGSADNYGDDFTNVSAPFYASGNGIVTNSYLDPGGQTNFLQRFYRIRLTP